MSATLTIPRININSDIKDSEDRPFLARVTVDELRPNKYPNRPFQWVIGVKPYAFAVKNNGFMEYVGLSSKEINGEIGSNSKFGLHLAEWKKVFGDLGFDVGVGDLVGQIGWFVRKVYKYPPNKDGRAFETTLLIPTRVATPDELETIGETQPTPANADLSPDDATAILSVLEGKKATQFQKAAIQGNLRPEQLQAVVNGSAVRALEEAGVAHFNEAGEFVRA